MTAADCLRQALVMLEVNPEFTEAELRLHDDSRLLFCHRAGERWAKAVGTGQAAAQILGQVAKFRLNARHLDIHFEDASRWEAQFGAAGR